jgi:uncharacterized membrane protein
MKLASASVFFLAITTVPVATYSQSARCRGTAGMVSLPLDDPQLGGDATSINDGGVAVGWSGDDAALWDDGGYHRLGRTLATPDGLVEGLGALAWDVNNAGTVVGIVFDDVDSYGVVYDSSCGCFRALPSAAQARAITDDGVIVGGAITAAGPRVALWKDGELIKVLDATGAIGASPFDISESGVVVGQARAVRGGPTYPVMWANADAPMTWLNGPHGVPEPGFARGVGPDGAVIVGTAGGAAMRWSLSGDATVLAPSGTANAVNGAGVVVGFTGVNGEMTQPVAWTAAGAISLGSLGSGPGFARSINASGAIVGFSGTCAGGDELLAPFRIQLQASGR